MICLIRLIFLVFTGKYLSTFTGKMGLKFLYPINRLYSSTRSISLIKSFREMGIEKINSLFVSFFNVNPARLKIFKLIESKNQVWEIAALEKQWTKTATSKLMMPTDSAEE